MTTTTTRATGESSRSADQTVSRDSRRRSRGRRGPPEGGDYDRNLRSRRPRSTEGADEHGVVRLFDGDGGAPAVRPAAVWMTDVGERIARIAGSLAPQPRVQQPTEICRDQHDTHRWVFFAPRPSSSFIVSGYGCVRCTGPFAMSTVVWPERLTTLTSAPFETR